MYFILLLKIVRIYLFMLSETHVCSRFYLCVYFVFIALSCQVFLGSVLSLVHYLDHFKEYLYIALMFL